jgi:predicted phage baseplate assembly protein
MDFEFLPKLPKSNLDDRKFADLVEECILRIPRYCPEWTNHNPGDPGITLIELFAWLTDQMLLRFNQVPRRNYIAFLELLGIRLDPPKSAKCELTFYLSQSHNIIIPRGTEVATVRTSTEEAVVFSTDRDLFIYSPIIKYFLTGTDVDNDTSRRLQNRTPSNIQEFPETLLFSNSRPGDCFYLILECQHNVIPENTILQNIEVEEDVQLVSEEENLSGANIIRGNVIAIKFKGEAAATTGIIPENPPIRWEAWDGMRWQEILRVKEDDKTKGFSFSGVDKSQIEEADVILHLPQHFPPTDMGTEYDGYWIRCVYVQPVDGQRGYFSSPTIVGMEVRSIGGKVNATECVEMKNEFLGVSDGKPGQTFQLQAKPVLTRTTKEHIRVKLPDETSKSRTDSEKWKEVDNFAVSGREDPHYMIDSQQGQVQFGPLVREPSQLQSLTKERALFQPAGRITRRNNTKHDNFATYIPKQIDENNEAQALELQYGKVPPPGAEIYIVSYRTGGGSRGNVKREKITVLRTSIPYVKNVINYEDATGGIDAETLDEAVMRVPELLKTRECAVIPKDYERIAKEAPAKRSKVRVSRAHCLRNYKNTTPGQVNLLIVPDVDWKEVDWGQGIYPKEFKLTEDIKDDILGYMNERKPLGIHINLQEPYYVGVTVKAEVFLEDKYKNNQYERNNIKNHFLNELYRFLNPIFGGFDGEGWEMGRCLYPSDIIAISRKVTGINFLGIVKLYAWRQDREEWLLDTNSEAKIDPGEFGLIFSCNDPEQDNLPAGHIIEFGN